MNIVTVFAARLEPVKLSDVPEKAYNSRSSEFVSFLAHPRHPYIGASTDAPMTSFGSKMI